METTQTSNGITIRRLGPGDEAAIERLAELDSKKRPDGDLMGVEIEGRLLIATSIATGQSVADPFSRTAELKALMDIRIAQMKGGGARRRLFGHRSKRARGSLAGSPPGAGGKLLTLPVRLS